MLATRGSGKVTTIESRATNKGHKVPRAHTTRPISKKAYAGSLPLCNQCKFHHNGTVALFKVRNCMKDWQKPINPKLLNTDTTRRLSNEPAPGKRASKPKTMQDTIEFVTKLMDKKISTPAECQAEKKRKLDNTSKNNQNQQQPNKWKNTGRAYIAGHGEKKHYGGSKPLCSKCNYHHDGSMCSMPQCYIVGHLDHECWSSQMPISANTKGHWGKSEG
ncbi:hypothetical protein Tco_0769063 [Tanacetum coccineum]|uniref:Uncharacterized protein n=1 Tax=Tanacetum coccineum TaxID=301880 RepID=A0ABQ4ZBR4_9ASTR